jgi:hypothetical protein
MSIEELNLEDEALLSSIQSAKRKSLIEKLRDLRYRVASERWDKMCALDPTIQSYVDKANEILDRFFKDSHAERVIRER